MNQGAATWLGRRLGVYKIISAIGAGGMGDVYRAHDTRLDRDVALKILPLAFADEPHRLARFEREARVLASLNHPNIATIYGVEEADPPAGSHEGTVLAIVMELVEGQTLAERIGRGDGASRSWIPVGDALAIARQIADALDAAHEKGIVHRDIKPANVMITRDGVPKVLDFGIAKTGGSNGDDGLTEASTITFRGTREGAVLGTAAYMSPEQARGLPVDKRTDIWAFGCVLYEMLAGRMAFEGKTTADTLAAILEREPDWSALPPATPPIVVRLLRRCLEKDPRRRLRDIADVQLEIEDALNRPAVVSPAPVASPRSRVGERLVWALGIGILALLASWLLYSDRLSREPAVVALSVLPADGTTFHSEGAYPAVSPDGRQVVFVALASGGQQQLWVRRVDSTILRALEGTDGATRPFWSPDSRSIAFFANGQLRRIDVDTSSTRVICDAPYRGGMAGTWGDGVIVVAGHPGGLARVPASGGQMTIAVASGEDADPITPSFLPDGRHFVYAVTRAQQEQSQICVASVDSTETSCVLNAHSPVTYAAPGYLLFVRNRALHAQPFDPRRLEASGEAFRIGDAEVEGSDVYNPPLFSASDNGILAYHSRVATNSLLWLDRSGRALGTPLGAGDRPALSPDETRIVLQRSDPQTNTADLWLHEASRGVESRFTFHPGEDAWPAFSPDGEHVVFMSTRTGRGQLYQKPTSGDGVEELIAPEAAGASPDWSSDGRFVIYQRGGDPKTGFDLWAVPLSGDRKPFPIAQTEHGEREGRFSPDVRWVAYDSTETGRREVWIQPFPTTGSRWQISTSGGVSPQWRRDGRELFFVAADGSLTAVAIDAGTTLKWGAPQPLFQTIFRAGAYASYAVSRDGQRFLTNVPPSLEDTLPITIVMNWTAMLEK